MRVYVPATIAWLRDWLDAALVPASAERYVADGEGEEPEYAALIAAAADSCDLLDGAGRRVVVVAEVDEADGEIPFRQIEAVHADAADRPVGSDPEEDLGWFAVQEVDALLG